MALLRAFGPPTGESDKYPDFHLAYYDYPSE